MNLQDEMKRLIDLKTKNELSLILNFWKEPHLFDNWSINPTTIIDEDARNLYVLGKEMYNDGYEPTNLYSIIEYISNNKKWKLIYRDNEDMIISYFKNEVIACFSAITTTDFERRFEQQSLLATKIKAIQFLNNKEIKDRILNSDKVEDIIDNLSIDVENLQDSRYNERIKHVETETDEEFMERFTQKEEKGYKYDNVSPILSKCTNGFGFGRISSIAGLSGVGKSQFTTYFVVYSQLEQGHKVLLITNELEPKDYFNMLYSIVCKEKFNYRFDRENFEDTDYLMSIAQANNEEFQMLLKARKYVKENYMDKELLHIIDTTVCSMKDVMKNIRIYSKQDFRICVYDTAKPDKSSGQAWADVTDMMKELNNTCKYCNVHLFMPWQLSNSNDGRKRLTRQHLSESKDLPKLLTNFMTIRKVYEEEYPTENSTGLKCMTQRIENGMKITREFQLDRNKKYMIVYLDKLRFSKNGGKHLLLEYDGSTATFKEVGWCLPQKDKPQWS